MPDHCQEKSEEFPDAKQIFSRILLSMQPKSIPAIAAELGITKQSVYEWRDGSMPSLATLVRIARVSNTSLHWLVTGEGPAHVGPGVPSQDDPEAKGFDYLAQRFREVIAQEYEGITPEEALQHRRLARRYGDERRSKAEKLRGKASEGID